MCVNKEILKNSLKEFNTHFWNVFAVYGVIIGISQPISLILYPENLFTQIKSLILISAVCTVLIVIWILNDYKKKLREMEEPKTFIKPLEL